jgi:hypothetical protein
VDLDARIVRRRRAAQEERLVSLAEDEEIGQAILQRLGLERPGEQEEDQTPRQ